MSNAAFDSLKLQLLSIKNKHFIDMNDIVYGIYPEVSSLPTDILELFHSDILEVLNKVNVDLFIEQLKANERETPKVVRVFRSLGILYIMVGLYDKFIELIDKEKFNFVYGDTTSIPSHGLEVRNSIVHSVANSLTENVREFDRFTKNIPLSFIQVQVEEDCLHNLYFKNAEVKTFTDFYNKVYVPYLSQRVSLTEFCENNKCFRNISLDVEGAKILCSIPEKLYFRTINTFKLQDIETLLELSSKYSLEDINLTDVTIQKFTEETLDKYLEASKDASRINFHRLTKEALTDKLISKHIGKMHLEYSFCRTVQDRFSLKEMLKILEGECA